MSRSVVIFDVGNVLIEWNVKHLYRKLMASDAEIDAFVAEVDLMEWNKKFDAGVSFAEGVRAMTAAHPHRADLIKAFEARWEETCPYAITDSVAVLERLKAAGVPVFAITNFSTETWPLALKKFPFLGNSFRDVVVSGDVRMIKPAAAIYQVCLERNDLNARDCVFIDDRADNIAAAEALGIAGILFTPETDLAAELQARGILAAASGGSSGGPSGDLGGALSNGAGHAAPSGASQGGGASEGGAATASAEMRAPTPEQRPERRDNMRRERDPNYNFAYLDENTKRMIRRAILKAVAVPGYQTPFASREMPMPYGWGTGGVQLTAACLTPKDVLKVIDQGADDTTNAVSIRMFFERTAGRRRHDGDGGGDHHPNPPPHPGRDADREPDPRLSGPDPGASAVPRAARDRDAQDACPWKNTV